MHTRQSTVPFFVGNIGHSALFFNIMIVLLLLWLYIVSVFLNIFVFHKSGIKYHLTNSIDERKSWHLGFGNLGKGISLA